MNFEHMADRIAILLFGDSRVLRKKRELTAIVRDIYEEGRSDGAQGARDRARAKAQAEMRATGAWVLTASEAELLSTVIAGLGSDAYSAPKYEALRSLKVSLDAHAFREREREHGETSLGVPAGTLGVPGPYAVRGMAAAAEEEKRWRELEASIRELPESLGKLLERLDTVREARWRSSEGEGGGDGSV